MIIIGEWLYAVWAQKQALTSTTAAETKMSQDKMPVVELTRQPEQSYADLVARPLFIKGRRPVDEPTPEEELAQQAKATVTDVFDWQLSGVYTTKKGLSALFSRDKSKVVKDNNRRISTGADLSGWKLTEIRTDRAILKQGAQQKELLLRKPKLKDSSKRPNVPNQPNNVPQPEISPPPPADGEFEENINE
jgi:predicted phage tail protein